MRREGAKKKVLLFPYEGWAQPASATYLALKTNWWSKKHCNVVQVCGDYVTGGQMLGGRAVDKGKLMSMVFGKGALGE